MTTIGKAKKRGRGPLQKLGAGLLVAIETWNLADFCMASNRTGYWDRNSSLGPEQRPYSTSHVEGRPRNRLNSPRQVIRLPSVEFTIGPTPSRTMLASSPSPKERRNCSLPCRVEPPTSAKSANGRGGNQESKSVKGARERLPAMLQHRKTLPIVQNELSLTESKSPQDTTCRHCGLRFNRLSLDNHTSRCSRQQSGGHRAVKREPPVPWRQEECPQQGSVVARVVTLGLGGCETVYIHSKGDSHRPMTRTLPRSTLHDVGHGLPFADAARVEEQDTSNGACKSSSAPFEHCAKCNKVVAADKLSIHQRLCQNNNMPRLSMGVVSIPSTHNLLRVGQQRDASTDTHRPAHPRAGNTAMQKPTVVCYICGREYGTHSISIHEPQCLKKFHAQNDLLPIEERLPVPKKKNPVARVLLREEVEEVVVAGIPQRLHMDAEMESQEEKLQRYLESCYADFERELVPCKKCGRTFAPARHRKHESSCNARPMKIKML